MWCCLRSAERCRQASETRDAFVVPVDRALRHIGPVRMLVPPMRRGRHARTSLAAVPVGRGAEAWSGPRSRSRVGMNMVVASAASGWHVSRCLLSPVEAKRTLDVPKRLTGFQLAKGPNRSDRLGAVPRQMFDLIGQKRISCLGDGTHLLTNQKATNGQPKSLPTTPKPAPRLVAEPARSLDREAAPRRSHMNIMLPRAGWARCSV